MKTKHGIFILLFVSIPAWTQEDPCGEGGAATYDCSCEFNRRMNEMADDYQDDVRKCGGFLEDPTFWMDMAEAYQKPKSGGGFGPLSTMNDALECLREADDDLTRQCRAFGDEYDACLRRYGC